MTKRTLSIGIEGFEGSIVIRRLRNMERLAMLEEMGLDQNKLAALASDKKAELSAEDVGMNLKKLGKLVTHAGTFVESVDLKSEEVHFQSWDDLDFDPAGMQIQMQVMTHVMGMGKN